MDKVVKGVFELNIITNDYLLHHEDRAQTQWGLKYASLAQLLAGARYKDPEEQAMLEQITQILADIQPLFSQLLTNYETRGLSEEEMDLSLDLEQRLVSQLMVKAQTMVAVAFRLTEAASAKVEIAQRRGSYLLMAVGGILLALMVSIIILTSNSMVARITNLQRGTEIIAAGDLDHQVEIRSDDEISQLSRAFNEMTHKLKESYTGLNEEIATRKKAEEALRKSEQWLSTTLRCIGDALIATDPKGLVAFMNPVAEELTGWGEAEAVGKPLEDIFNIINEQTGERAENPVARVLREGVVVGLANHTVLIAKDGTKRPIADSGAPIRDEEGNIIGIVMVFRDITERRRVEQKLKEYSDQLEALVEERTKDLQDAQERLIRKEKLAILGQLAGGVGHDLRNPLGAIKNAAYFLNMVLEEPDPEVKETLEILEKEVGTSEAIISSLLDFARAKPPTKRKISVNEVLQETLSRITVPGNVEVVQELDESLPQILADPDQLRQVFGNVILNAFQAMPEGGELTVTSMATTPGWVDVSIADTGAGIDVEHSRKVFEPLFTTKAKGIGLGLAITKSMVEGHGGTIEVESEPGKGSTFTVKLPTGMEEES